MNGRDKESKIYFSRKLTRKLEAILTFSHTVINAPFGYGKTTSLRAFFEASKVACEWIECTSSSAFFWEQYCEVIEQKSEKTGVRIRDIGYPATPKQLQEFCRCMADAPSMEKAFLVIDNFHLLEDEIMDFLFLPGAHHKKMPFSVVLITEGVSSKVIQNLAFKNQILYLDKEDFALEPPDIKEYFRNYNIAVDIEEAQAIHAWSSGWMVILQACASHYKKHHDFFLMPRIHAFIKTSLWDNIAPPVQSLFLNLAIFDRFTISLAEAVNYEKCENLYNILEITPCLDFDGDEFHYTFHPIFKSFLMARFKNLSQLEKVRTYRTAAGYYRACGEFFYAIVLYCESGDFAEIFAMIPNFYNLYNHINNKNRKYFLLLSHKFWAVERKGTHAFTIMLAFIMFLYGEKETLRLMCGQIEEDIKTDDDLSPMMKNHYMAELEFVKSYLEFNDIIKMLPYYKRAYEYSKIPLYLLPNVFPYTFGIPSVLALLFNRPGTLLQSMEAAEQSIDIYYTITHGHAKGMTSLFKAEYFYLAGDFKNAEIFCHKASYMAESRNQYSLVMAACMVLQRIAICQGNWEAYCLYEKKMDTLLSQINSSNLREYLRIERDIARTILCFLLGEPEKIASWVKDSLLLEQTVNRVALSYVFNLHARYLYMTGDYQKFIGVSGRMLGLAEMYAFPFPKIHAYLYVASANLAVNEQEKAAAFFKDAVELAVLDNLYLPFVESYSTVKCLMDNYNTTKKEINSFFKEVHRLYKVISPGLHKCQKIIRNQNNHGLTPREAEIAGLAAQRYSNRQIGERLFIAESTVKSNMKIIFNKLGIASREELEKFF